MNQSLFFKAPWSPTVTIITGLTVLLMLGITLSLVRISIKQNFTMMFLAAMIPLLILLITALFSVRGYLVTNQTLQIARLGWFTEVPLVHLESAIYDPHAMNHSLRIFGNGGLFAFTGRFRNKKLGLYQAYATDPSLSVVLKFPKKTVVVTPQRPEQFVEVVVAAAQSPL